MSSEKKRSGPMPRDIGERFWDLVDKRGPDDCWNWKAAMRSKRGKYGAFQLGRKKVEGSHVMAYRLTNGDIPKGMFVCHSCDNPKCCNPKHLFLGTSKQNSEDMVSKGRSATGERNAAHKLTETAVSEIRAKFASGECTRLELSLMYRVSETTISLIVNRRRWAHVA